MNAIRHWVINMYQIFKEPAASGRIALVLILPNSVVNSKKEKTDVINRHQYKMAQIKLDIFLIKYFCFYSCSTHQQSTRQKQNP